MKTNKSLLQCITGNEAAALAVMFAKAQVVPVYPITPATGVSEKIASLKSEGKFHGTIILAESEHSAMAMCVGASKAGVRTFLATSSQGLLYMAEMLHWAAGSRLPIVMVNVNRAICAPWALWPDNNDSMAFSGTGFMQFHCEDAQEVFDTVLMAYRLSEMVRIPSMVCYDGFLISHASEPVVIPEQATVDAFLPSFKADDALNPDEPRSYGNLMQPEDFTKIKHNFHDDIRSVPELAEGVAEEFGRAFERKASIVLDSTVTQYARTIVLSMGSMSSTARDAFETNPDVDTARVKMFRPFPYQALGELVSHYERVIVLDRNISPGQGGHLCTDVRSALFGMSNVPRRVYGYIVGLNGTDITPTNLEQIVHDAEKRNNDFDPILWR